MTNDSTSKFVGFRLFSWEMESRSLYDSLSDAQKVGHFRPTR